MNEIKLLERTAKEYEIAEVCFNDVGSAHLGIIHFLHAWHGICLLQRPDKTYSFGDFLSDPSTPDNPGLGSGRWAQAMEVLQSAKTGFLENEWHQLQDAGIMPGFPRANRTLQRAISLIKTRVRRQKKIGVYNPKLRLSAAVLLGVTGLFLLGIEVKRMIAPKVFAVSVFDNADFAGAPILAEMNSLDFVDTISVGGQRLSDRFSFRAVACLNVKKASKLSMAVTSDDGSRVFIDGKLFIDNWGVHALVKKKSEENLSVGVHTVSIEFNQVGGPAGLRIEGELSPPGEKSSSIYDVLYSPGAGASDCD